MNKFPFSLLILSFVIPTQSFASQRGFLGPGKFSYQTNFHFPKIGFLGHISIFSRSNTLGNRKSITLGTRVQASSSNGLSGAVLEEYPRLFITGLAIAGIGFLTITGGNIYAAIINKSQLEWGRAAAIWSGLGTAINLGMVTYFLIESNFREVPVFSLVALAFNLGLLGFGVFHIRNHTKRNVQLMGFAPWFDYSRQTKAVSGGLSLSGIF